MCVICYSTEEKFLETKCGHTICEECYSKLPNFRKTCPYCRLSNFVDVTNEVIKEYKEFENCEFSLATYLILKGVNINDIPKEYNHDPM